MESLPAPYINRMCLRAYWYEGFEGAGSRRAVHPWSLYRRGNGSRAKPEKITTVHREMKRLQAGRTLPAVSWLGIYTVQWDIKLGKPCPSQDTTELHVINNESRYCGHLILRLSQNMPYGMF